MAQRTLVSAAMLHAALALSAACGGGQTEATPPAAPSATQSAVPTAPPSASAAAAPTAPPGPGEWVTWSHEKKLGYMKAAVMPKMGGAFHDFDGAMFASPKCTLCHNTGAKDGTFKMPDVGLPKLPANPADFKTLAATEPKVFDFMVKTVVPQTAALLGEPPYDPVAKTGFGCFGCHTKS